MPNKWISSVGASGALSEYADQICEEFGTRNETFGATNFNATAVLRVPWEARFLVFWDIYQNNVPYPDVPGAYISSYSCAPDMQAPIDSALDGVIPYADALLTLNYSTDEADAQKLFTQVIEPATEFRVLPKEKFYWGTASVQDRAITDKEAPGQLNTMWNYTVRWLQQAEVPYQYNDHAGAVNNAAYTVHNVFASEWIFPAESMLYQPGAMTKSVFLKLAATGTTPPEDKVPFPGWDYVLKFIINAKYDYDAEQWIGVWNKPYNAQQKDVTDGNEAGYYKQIFRKPDSGTGDGTAHLSYPPETFEVATGEPDGVNFLPPNPSVVVARHDRR